MTQIVSHRDGSFRGMIVDIDPWFMGSDDWYQKSIKTNAPVDEPWYYVVVDGADYATYVPESDLVPSNEGKPVENPIINSYHGSNPKQEFHFH
ncbi:MAG: heat shock protein HspQ [bacterium]|nr:heat shock protein HspQ [bacterium]